MTETLLGIDAGTSSIKVCAFSSDGKLLAKAQRAVPVITPYPLWAEIDVEHYWELTTEAIKEVTARCPSIKGIGLSSTCPTTIVLDQNKRPLRPGIVYLDGRAGEVVRDIAGSDAASYQKKTGNRSSPSTCWAANLCWIQRNEPHIWKQVSHICMLNSYLALRLTGEFGIDPTQASYSGLVDVRKNTPVWSASLVELWGIDEKMLAPLASSSESVGQVTAEVSQTTGLTAGTSVALGAADTAVAAFALGLSQRGDAFESVGTSGVITFCLDQPEFDDSFLNRYHIYPDRWLAHGAMSTLGGSFGWLQSKVWPEVRSFPELESLAQESVAGANGIVFLPYLAGERSPIWDAEASAAWIGLRLEHSRADMVRAVFEGAAFGLKQILRQAELRWGWRPQRLVGVGGGAHSKFWAQIKADILQLEYGMAEQKEASALGAALLGGLASGIFNGFDDKAIPTMQVTSGYIKPGTQQASTIYERQFSIFASLYPILSPAMHALGTDRLTHKPVKISLHD
jgi:xylulokinase